MNTETLLRTDQNMKGVLENGERCGENSIDDIKRLHAHENKDLSDGDNSVDDIKRVQAHANKDLSDFKHSEDTIITDNIHTEFKIELDIPDESESVEPFICGLCYDKYDNFIFYISHLESHKSLDRFLHTGCKREGLENTMCYTCHKCYMSFPSLCLLETHLIEIENTSNFVITGRTKMAYIPKADCLSDWEAILERTAEKRDKVEDHDQNPKAAYMTETNVSQAKRKRGINKTAMGVIERPNLMEGQENVKSENSNFFDEEWKTLDQDSDNETVDLEYDYKKVKENTKKLKSVKSRRKKIKLEIVKQSIGISNENDQVVEDHGDSSEVKRKRKYVSQKKVKKVKLDPNEKVPCSTCGAVFSRRLIHLHKRKHDTKYGSKTKKVKKVKLDQYEKVPCSTCGAVFIRRLLHLHRRKHEVKKKKTIRVKPCPKDIMLPCEICGKNLNRRSMDTHILTHYPPTFKCNICGIQTKTKAAMWGHKTHVHATESKYTCDKCGKAFKAPHYLKQHSLIHKAVPDIMCPLCPRKFYQRQSLRAHLFSHTDQRPCSCDVCHKSYKTKARLKHHKSLVHSDETPHACSFCDKRFKSKQDISKHEKIHKPPENICPVCKKGFIQRSNMKLHMKSQHPTYLEQSQGQSSNLEQDQGQHTRLEQNK